MHLALDSLVLNLGLQTFSDCPYGWLLLCEAQKSLHHYQGAANSAQKGIRLAVGHVLCSLWMISIIREEGYTYFCERL